ncbi:MAG: hypothetical protein KAV82_07885, partial [Phycisphaerae bacterium]|nr:hypothetical protein [Phycisphaerae bacterium]
VLNPRMGPGMLENMAGFGPQMMMEESGSFTIMGEAAGGPISANVDSQMCITILPGTGFMPVPDFVIQVKTKHAEKLIESIRKATKKINKLYRRREQPRPWHKATVKDRPIFWSNAGAVRGAILMPWVMRPVLFVTTETDARDRERDFLVLAFTTTSPKNLVRRWIEMPRPKDRRFLPEKRKVHGQMWVNWEQTYKWIQPYLNLSLSIVSRDLLLPSAKEMSDKLTDASLTMKVRYEGVRVSHRGPIPAGVVAVPTLLGIASEMESRGSDLARERSACRRLKVFYHHAKLFERDMGRWPAELAELDGYIDFAGHPYLTRLELSPKKRRSDWFESVIESDDEDEEDEEEEEDEDEAWISIDDDQFVIEWGRELWTLGVAPGTFEHLDNLYIDQDGNIHRVEKKPAAESDGRKDKDHEDNDSDNE